MAPSIAASAPQAAFPWTPSEATLKRRLRARPPLGPVPQVDRMVDAQGCCGPLCEHDAQPPARPGPPPVRHDLVALLPEGGELLEGGRRWVRLPGGRPLLVDDAWATEAGGAEQDTVLDRVEQLSFDSAYGSGSTVQLALNAPMLFHHEDEGEEWYGPTEAIIDDLYHRGVRTVRHPGLAQMFLDKLLNMGRDPSTPILREAMSTPTDVASLVEASSSLSKLLTLAPLLRARQMKVIVTMLTLGGGSTPSPAETRDSVDGVAGRLRKSPAVHWGEDWAGTALTDDWTEADVPFNRHVGDWDTTTMDPANPCKRLIYRWISRALGAWLDAHADELQDVLAGIEICNEVDVVQVFEADAKPGTEQVLPQHWGVLYADCAAELRMQCDWVPLWLPGLATYLEDGVEGSKDAWTFWGKVSFAGELIPVIDGRLKAIGSGIQLVDIFEGIDVHWYHTSEQDRRRAILLPLELFELQRALNEALADAGAGQHSFELTVIESGMNVICRNDDDPTQCEVSTPGSVRSAHYRPPLYTSGDGHVLEEKLVVDTSGFREVTDPVTGATYHLPLGGSPFSSRWVLTPAEVARQVQSRAGALDWQAANLLLQCFMALAGGSLRFGPHGHVSTPIGSPFAGYGIRQDLNVDHRRKKASDAGLRPAGAMLQRIASLLGRRKVEAQLVWPEGYTRNDLAETRARRTVGDQMAAGTWPVQNHACAVEVALFNPTAGRDSGLTPELDLVPSDYLYLLFIDGVPGWNEPSVTSTATPDPTPPAARVRLYLCGEGTVLQVPMAASSIVEADAGRDAFPSVSIAWPPDEALPILNLASLRYVEVVVHRGATPVLLSSSTRLQVEDVSILPIGVG